ncbi:MAG: RluA family pseudouridine synthase [Verrucomicrobiia bacterium]
MAQIHPPSPRRHKGARKNIRLSRNLEVEVLYEDKWLLAVNKPAGLLIANESWERTQRNLMRLLQDGIEKWAHWAVSRGLRFLKNVHRLDAPTTGVLLLAKSKPALRSFSELFRRRAVEKIHCALVAGAPKSENFDITLPLASHPKIAGRMIVDAKQENPHTPHVDVLDCKGFSVLVRVKPLTGRTHQIRVQLAAVGLPIIGDSLCGSGDAPRNSRLQLHAAQLTFDHPFTRKQLTITAPIPSDFRCRRDWAGHFTIDSRSPRAATAGKCQNPFFLVR